MMILIVLLKKRGKEGEELKALHYTSTVVIYNYIIAYNIIPNTSNSSFVVAIYIQIPLN